MIVIVLVIIFYALFSRYLIFCVFVKSTNFKICDVIISICYIMEVILMLIAFESYLFSEWNLVKYSCAAWKTLLTWFWLNAGDWTLVPSSFMILLKRQYRKIWQFSIVEIYRFKMFFIHFFKKPKHWNLDISGYWVIGVGW